MNAFDPIPFTISINDSIDHIVYHKAFMFADHFKVVASFENILTSNIEAKINSGICSMSNFSKYSYLSLF